MLTELELQCLCSISDDYEEIPQIILDMKGHFNVADVPASEISHSLHKLCGSGFAQAYEFDESRGNYVDVEFEPGKAPIAAHTWPPNESTASRVWFYITPAGLDYLQANRSQLNES